MLILLQVIVIFSLSAGVYSEDAKPKAYKLPSYIKVCHRSDPDLDSCVQNSVEELRPMLAKGIPELGVPSCDPLLVPELVIHQGHGSIAIHYTYSNIQIYGASNFLLHSVRMDLNTSQIRVNLTLPELRMAGNYSVAGQILMLPIAGTGYSVGNYTDIQALAVIQCEKTPRYGKDYLQVTDFILNIAIGHASLQLSDLFNGDKELGDSMNSFINENWRSIAEDVKPVLEETLGNMLKKFSNKIFHRFTLDELLPP